MGLGGWGLGEGGKRCGRQSVVLLAPDAAVPHSRRAAFRKKKKKKRHCPLFLKESVIIPASKGLSRCCETASGDLFSKVSDERPSGKLRQV